MRPYTPISIEKKSSKIYLMDEISHSAMNKEVGFPTLMHQGNQVQSQHPVCKWTHDVFPSFRGEDVRRTFLSHILKELRGKGITPFIDDEIKRGEFIGPELIQAIRRSKIAVVLLSRNYASSKWCLDELAEIIKCKKELAHLEVFPIFYEVDPSHVKKLTGEFGAVFDKTCAGKTKEDVARWRLAFEELATIAGYDSRNRDNEAIMIEDIVTEISKRLFTSSPSRYIQGLIGMGAHIEKMKLLLCLDSDEVRRVGIWGPPGIGKTTIARVTFEQISGDFERSVFMEMEPSYLRKPRSDDYNVKLQLEQQLLSLLTNQKDVQISGLGAAQKFLTGKKVLVVLDGVDDSIQLDTMQNVECLGPGTRIIVTTQNSRLLDAFNIKHIYGVDLPPDHEALQIFCMNAFGQSYPKDGFKKLSREVTNLVGRLPLGLKIMGSHFQGILSKQGWKAELPRLRVRLDGDIVSILKFSYDALQEDDKDLFLHIACFFFEKDDLNDVNFEDILQHRFSNVRRGLEVLVQRSLVSMDRRKHYSMHDLLVQLGREIVRNQSIYEPGKRHFLVDAKEIYEVLNENTGSKNVIGINFDDFKTEDDLYISERAFEELSNLQLLKIHSSFHHHKGLHFPQGHKRLHFPQGNKRLHFPQGLKYLPSQLRLLDWDHYPTKSLPCNFNPKFLVKIKLKYSKLKNLWKGIQPLGNLKYMDLTFSTNLKKLPDLSAAINLVDLDLNSCSSLVKLPSSIGNLTNLIYLNLSRCLNLKELPSCFGHLGIRLRGCSSVLKLLSSIGNLTNLQDLVLSECSSLVELPSSFENLTNLKRLDLRGCSSLVELPSSIGNLINLQNLKLEGCSSLVKIPFSVGNLQLLNRLDLQRCSKLEVLPGNINLASLETLDVSGCSKLRSFPEISTNIEQLKLCGTLIEEVPLSVKSWSRLEEVEIPSCKNLGEFPNLLNIITKLELNDTDIEEFPLWFSGVSQLRHLALYNCRKLVSLPQLPYSLRNLEAENCESLERLAGSFPNPIHSLRFIKCWKLNEEARDIIVQSSLSSYYSDGVISPEREVPEFFTHRSTTGSSVKVNLGGDSKRFKGCISLVYKGDREARYVGGVDVSCKIMDKQSRLVNSCRGHHPINSLLTEHMYIFQFETDEVISGKVLFQFKLRGIYSRIDKWEIAQCGIRTILEEED